MEYHQDLFLRSLTSCYQTIKQTYRKILGSFLDAFLWRREHLCIRKALMQDHTVSTRKALKQNHCISIMIFQLYTSFEAMQSFRENKNATRIAISINRLSITRIILQTCHLNPPKPYQCMTVNYPYQVQSFSAQKPRSP